MDIKTVLVTGATGNVGRHIAAGLKDTGITVRAVSRDPSRDRLPAGAGAVAGDLADPDSVRAAAAGADAAFLLWPFVMAEGADAAVRAIAAHVRRIVYLSAMSVHDEAAPEDNGVWGQVEQSIERSGAEWTFLRAGGFATNTLAWAERIRSDGVVRWVYGEAARSLIHERDIADVAVHALAEDGHAGAKYLLTGPEAITQADQARIIGEATGLPVAWEEASPGEIRGQLAAVTGDHAFADHALAYWASLVGHPEPVTRTVEEITGTPARTFRGWARDHAGDFRPRSPEEVVTRYVSLLRRGDFGAALKLLASDVVRVAPLEPSGGGAAGLRGVEAIVQNSGQQNAGYEIRGIEIDGPYSHGDRFAVRFAFDETHLSTGDRASSEKMSVYTVRDGAIVREDVYHHTPPHGASR
jgi:uncharacterized protein YbjT (DUF2867 family)/ketosteroid isomerase-like protein